MGTMCGDMAGLDFERMSLQELLPYWSNLMWWVGMRPVFHRMVEANLTLSENIVLRSLQRSPLTVAEVAGCLYISHSAASRAIDRLVHDGFVSRQEHPEDRRQKQLTLTAAGAALLQEMEWTLSEGVAPLVTGLAPDEQEQLRHLLGRILSIQQADGGLRCPPAGRGVDTEQPALQGQSALEGVGGI